MNPTNNKKYIVLKNSIRIEDADIVFEDDIKEVIEVSDMLILLMVKEDGYFPSENVFGVNLMEKAIKWRIAKLKYETGEICPFVGIKLHNNQL